MPAPSHKESRTDPMITPEEGLGFIIDGKEMKFKHIAPKRSNLVKMNLIDVQGGSEGIWVCLDDKDMQDYENDVMDGPDVIRVALLRNDSILGIPWGAYIPYQMRGTERPVSNFLMRLDGSVCFNQVETVDNIPPTEAVQ